MSIQNDIKELLDAGVITDDTARRIEEYYRGRPSPANNRLLAIFAVLGSVLIGLGIILILAHNWDDLSRTVKTAISFMPLVMGQAACFYTLMVRRDSMAWSEASSTFLFFGVGSCIALLAQIYNISSSGGTFILTWCLLTLPVAYIMRSSMVALLYILFATYYVVDTSGNLIYFGLIAAVIPYYYLLIKRDENGNFLAFMNWVLPLSLLIGIGVIVQGRVELMVIMYLCLFALCYQFSNICLLKKQTTLSNGYKIIGLLGIAIVMLFFSFRWFWEELAGRDFSNYDTMLTITVITVSVALTLVLFILQNRRKKPGEINPVALSGLVFSALAFGAAGVPLLSQWVSNILIFIVGMYYIRRGARNEHFGVLNYGLLLIAALIACRFFDSNLSFVLRGILFILIGIALFAVNLYMHKKRKANEQ